MVGKSHEESATPKGGTGTWNRLYAIGGDASIFQPEEITRLSKLSPAGEITRHARDIRNAARLNYESINAELSALPTIVEFETVRTWRKTRERGNKRVKNTRGEILLPGMRAKFPPAINTYFYNEVFRIRVFSFSPGAYDP